MEQIIKAISTNLNLPESVVRSGVGILLNFLKQKSAGTQFESLLSLLPGAAAMMSAQPAAPEFSEGGLLGGLLKSAGSMLGGNLGAAAEVASALQGAGVPLDKAGPLASQFLEHAKQVAGPDAISDLLGQIPELKSFINTK